MLNFLSEMVEGRALVLAHPIDPARACRGLRGKKKSPRGQESPSGGKVEINVPPSSKRLHVAGRETKSSKNVANKKPPSEPAARIP